MSEMKKKKTLAPFRHFVHRHLAISRGAKTLKGQGGKTLNVNAI